MLKITQAGCLGLSPAISLHFTVEMCVAAKNCEKFNKTFLLRVQSRPRSSMLTNLKSPSPVLVMISSRSALICNRLHSVTLRVFGVEGGKADFQKFPKGGSPRRQVFEILG